MRSNWCVYPMAYLYWFQKEQFMFEHDTNENWTMFAVESGQFTYRIGEHEGTAGFGDLVVCPPGIPFHRKTLKPLTFHFIQFIWEVEPTDDEAAELAGKLTLSDTGRLTSTYRYLHDIGEMNRDEVTLTRMKHMLEDLWRLVEMERSTAEEEQRALAQPELIMQTARLWLLTHAFQPISMRQLSSQLGISPVQLTRQFRSAYRMTPSAFVTGLRLGRACRLLEETALPLDAIATSCGYENGFYLSRVFSNNKGTTPSAYRKLHRV